MNEDQAPRQDGKGQPCPPWCTADHERVRAWGTDDDHMGDLAAIELGRAAGYGRALTRAVRFTGLPGLQVQVGATGAGGSAPFLYIGPDYAVALAAIIETLGAASPDAHRELAAAIRQAAADITAEAGEKP